MFSLLLKELIFLFFLFAPASYIPTAKIQHELSCTPLSLPTWFSRFLCTLITFWFKAGDETTSRFASRFNTSYIQAYTVLSMLLPGTPVLYYGDEINMVDGSSTGNPWQRIQPMRTIMQWENTTDAGFQACNTSCSPVWVGVNDFGNDNVKVGIHPNSSLTILFRKLWNYHPSLSWIFKTKPKHLSSTILYVVSNPLLKFN